MHASALSDQVARKAPGKLTIFASYFCGAGKRHAMLEAARAAKREGQDVVIGLLSFDAWPSDPPLAEDFETVHCKTVAQDGHTESELDLDACIKRRPQLILIEDLSHTNIDGSRHRKRCQDIEELLKAGIDVYTTLDVQHIESIQDTVFSILGFSTSERIPDHVFDRASRVEFIDIEPERLQQRLLEQKKVQLLSRYSLSQLSALRELVLRRCADRVALYTQSGQNGTGYRSHEHILVCLSSSPSNEKIIRTAARMASAFKCELTALFVETKDFQWMSPPDKERLRANIHLAQQLGASVETVYGDDVAYQISEFSHLSGVTKIVLGRSGFPSRPWFHKASLTDRLIDLTPELDIHIIPDNGMNHLLSTRYRETVHLPSLSLLDLFKSAVILVSTTLIGFLFYELGFTDANIIALYLLGVLLVSVSTKSSICSFFAAVFSVLTFNFCFTNPRFSLHVYESGYPVTFLVMFLVSLLTGSLASKLKSHAKRSAQVAWRTKLLFETNQTLQKARTQEEILSQVIVLAAFIAPIVDMGGNTGSQSATLVIRAMALGDVDLRWRDVLRVIRRELPVAAALGLVVALLESVLAFFSKGVGADVLLTVGLSMLVCTVLGGLIGALLPFMARRIGTDPATLSSPLITSIMDLVGVFIYFAFAYAFLSDMLR